ncbi:hypothetical protein K0504_06880 [Neiella marina]|uniref:Polysaccharide biosynthesis enzyme WcbI domain-containing protein n=1 Tax=Neiella holothuriorum TaxID=2870530 RepID=A0ABS7EEL2_9GAMM|nr:WcbI family polysaccharide biosynthesis putative acetyltransferase [Neiella holothuriorum]MBW8190753.1 hypothetical protein [Neiella holothuriorum]
MKLSIFGNCQGAALADYLSETGIFDVLDLNPIEPIQNIRGPDLSRVENIIGQADIFINQFISTDYFIKRLSSEFVWRKLKNTALSIKVPNMYFDGYFPHLGMFRGSRSVLNLVHDYNIIAGYLLGFRQDDLLDLLLSEKFYSSSTSQLLCQDSIYNLKKREDHSGCLKVSEYIANSYSERLLFNQFNHPTRFMFSHLWGLISQESDLLADISISSNGREHLDSIKCPIYPSTTKNLALQFDCEQTFHGVGGKLSWEQVIKSFYESYSGCERTVLKNSLFETKPWVVDNFKRLGFSFSA